MASYLNFSRKPVVCGLAVLFCCFVLVGCSQLALVKTVSPTKPSAAVEKSTQVARARMHLESAERLLPSNPKAAVALDEAAAWLCFEALKSPSDHGDDEVIALYNYAVARLIESTLASGLKPWEQEIKLSGSQGTFYLKLIAKSERAYVPGSDRLLAADRMKIGGVFFPERTCIDGIGAPFVSVGPGRSEPWAPDNHYYGVTAVIAFSGNHGTLRILDPNRSSTVALAGRSRLVSADLSAPLALAMTEVKPEAFGIKGLLRTDKHLGDAKLIMSEPYRPDRIPLILTHGLSSSPATWVPILNALNANPEIRKKYQIWVFRYPSGLPFPISADLLRQEIAGVYRKYPAAPKAVLIGHSMGGLLCGMLIRNSGKQYGEDMLGKPLDQFDFEPAQLKVIQGALEFKTSPHVRKVIFLATPHRGAHMASGMLGRLAASLIHLPSKMAGIAPKLYTKLTPNEGEELISRFPNSIDTLRPNGRAVLALNKIPITPSIPYYSIIGNNGGKDLLTGSDGIVPYSSSHLDGAKSELVVSSGHSGVLRDPEAIAEIQRILLLP